MTQELATKPTQRDAEAERTVGGICYRPHVDIVEQDDKLIVLADMPGATSEQIDVRYQDGTLTIHARVSPRQGEDASFLLHEYGVGDYFRSFKLNEMIDPGKISAEYAEGVLTLHLPKVEAVRPRKIPVATR